jgi:hypothetical protein
LRTGGYHYWNKFAPHLRPPEKVNNTRADAGLVNG